MSALPLSYKRYLSLNDEDRSHSTSSWFYSQTRKYNTASSGCGSRMHWFPVGSRKTTWPLNPQTPYQPSPDGSLPTFYQNVLDPLETYFCGCKYREIALGTCVIDMFFHNLLCWEEDFRHLMWHIPCIITYLHLVNYLPSPWYSSKSSTLYYPANQNIHDNIFHHRLLLLADQWIGNIFYTF